MLKFYQDFSSFKHRSYNSTGNFSIISITAALLAACGGGSGDGASSPQALSATSAPFIQFPANTITRVGTVVFSAVNGNGFTELGIPPTLVSASAQFIDFGQALSEEYMAYAFSIGETDTCSISIDSTDDSQDFGLDENALLNEVDLASRNVLAGNALTIATPSGSWPDLIIEDDAYSTYSFQTDGSMLGDVPKGTTLSIPGDEFPAFEQVTIPTASRLTSVSLVNAVDDQITQNTKVNWSVPNDLAAESIISLSTYNEIAVDGEELIIEMFCTVVDDGDFSFPSNAIEIFSKYETPVENFVLSRIRVNTVIQENAAVIVVNGAVYFY